MVRPMNTPTPEQAAMMPMATTWLARISVGMSGSGAVMSLTTKAIQNTRETPISPRIGGDVQP